MAYLVDTSVWIALAFDLHPHHLAVTSALSRGAVNEHVFSRSTQQSFLRLVSTPALCERYGMAGVTNADALALLAQIQSLPNVAFQEEPEEVVPLWHRLASRNTASPNLWMDAYLAAFAIQSGLTLLTLDAGFRQFESAGLLLQLLPGS